MEFTGFCPQGLDLLLENRLRDNKAFYEENKPALRQTVIEPFYALIEQLGPAMLRLDPQLIVEPKKCLARLRRDTRFTRDKTMYRDHVWCVFVRDKSGWSSKPCFYFSLNQEDFSYGAGYYQTPPPVMAAFRELVLEGDKDFAPLPEWLERSEFELDGETYRRNRYPQQPERLQPWLNSRSISVRAASTDWETAFSPALVPFLEDKLAQLAPLYHFLWKAERRAAQK